MKILILYHTLWIEMMADCWSLVAGAKISFLHINVKEWINNPEAKYHDAKRIMEMVKKEKPSFVLDINAAGVLPLDSSGTEWTTENVSTSWIEWWWDDPLNSYSLYQGKNNTRWFKALTADNATHFFWDKQLAAEYSRWFKKTAHYLPTAVHPGAFNPDGEKLSSRCFGKVDFSFLGSAYSVPEVRNSERTEVELISEFRIQKRNCTYFDIIDFAAAEIPLFTQDLSTSIRGDGGEAFSEKMAFWRNNINCLTGFKRRNLPLKNLIEKFTVSFITGFGFPAEFNASTEGIYQPLELTACYRNSFFCIDFANSQSFTGTNMRSYEIMSCEALLASSYYPDFDLNGKLDKVIYFKFSSAEELADIFKSHSGKTEKIDSMKRNARQYVLENHTWLNRFDSMMQILSK